MKLTTKINWTLLGLWMLSIIIGITSVGPRHKNEYSVFTVAFTNWSADLQPAYLEVFDRDNNLATVIRTSSPEAAQSAINIMNTNGFAGCRYRIEMGDIFDKN